MAFNGILYRAAGGTLEMNRSVGSFCTIESAKLDDVWQEGGVVTLVVVTTEILTFYSGDYIIAKGNHYIVSKTVSEYVSLGDGKHKYTIPLTSPDALFKNALMYNTVEHEDGGVYTWTRPNNFIMELGSIEVLVKTCCYNINEVMNRRVFKLGTISEDVPTDYRVVNFSDKNCWAALKQSCEVFETFYTIRVNTDETPDSDYIVDIGVEPGTFPETLMVGKRQGIAELTMSSQDEDVYTQFVVQGSTENLPVGYEHERLQLDTDLVGTPPVYDGSLIVVPEKYARWGRRRMELVFDYIKPSRPGTITSVPVDNIFAFYDTGLADIIAVEPNWTPVGGTVHILDGNLMGYTFEIIGFHSGTQKITIKQISDSNGYVLPNDESETFRFAKEMKYNLAGIALPASYVSDAKSELKAAAVDAIDNYWSNQRGTFSLTPDPFFLRDSETELSCGWLIPIKHDALEIDKSIRVTSVTYDLLKDTYFDIDSVEVADITDKDNFINSVHKSTQRSLNMLREQGIINSPTARESNLITLLNRIALSLNLPNWNTLSEMLGNDMGLFTLINEEGEDIHVVNVDLLRAGTALVNSLLTNEVFIAGLPSVSVPENALLVDENGRIDFTAAPDGELPGLYIDGYKLGYHNGTSWKTYMANNGDFYLAGTSADNYLTWISNTDTLTVKGEIHALSGSIGGLTIAADKIYLGDGVYGGATTPFYVDDDGRMSLKDKFKWDGTNLTINGGGTFSGALSAATGNFAGYISVGTAPNVIAIGKDAYGSGLHGIKLNAHNYWYLNGANAEFKIGGVDNYISWNGTSLTQNGVAIGGGSIVGTSIDIPNVTTPLFKVTNAGVITAKSGTIGVLKISATKTYFGIGDYGNTNTGFYVDTDSKFSLKDKLKFDGSDLTINGGGTFSGTLSAVNGEFNGLLDAGGIKIGLNAVSTGVGGLSIDANNYWDENGYFKAGGAASYVYWNGTTFAIKGDITGSTGTFGGVFAGTITVDETLKMGADAGGVGDFGLYIDSDNYWLESGFSVGVGTSLLYLDGSTMKYSGELLAASGTFTGSVSIGGVSIGKDAYTTGKHGIKLNANNYWYLDGTAGVAKIGDASAYLSYNAGALSMVGGSFSTTDGTTSVNISPSAVSGAGIKVSKGDAFAQIGLSGSWPSVSVREGGTGTPSALLTPGQVTVGDTAYATLKKTQLSLSGLVFNTTNLGTGNVVKTANGGFLRFGTSVDNEDASHTHQYVNGYLLSVVPSVPDPPDANTIYFVTGS